MPSISSKGANASADAAALQKSKSSKSAQADKSSKNSGNAKSASKTETSSQTAAKPATASTAQTQPSLSELITQLKTLIESLSSSTATGAPYASPTTTNPGPGVPYTTPKITSSLVPTAAPLTSSPLSSPLTAPLSTTAVSSANFNQINGEDVRLWVQNSDLNIDGAVEASELEFMSKQLTSFNKNASDTLSRLGSELRNNRTDPIFADGKLTFSERIVLDGGAPRVAPSELTQLLGRSGNTLSLEPSDLTTPSGTSVSSATNASAPVFRNPFNPFALPVSPFSGASSASTAASPFSGFGGIYGPFVFPS